MVVSFLLPILKPTNPGLIATVPFRLDHDEIIAKAWIRGRRVTVMLDTGTAPSVVDLRFANKIGLKPRSTGEAADGGGTTPQMTYELAPLEVRIGRMKKKRLDAFATDLSVLSKKFGRTIDAVLGDSLFEGKTIQFDYHRHRARFFKSFPKVPKNSVTLTFRHEDGEVHISGTRINGQAVEANLDTGSNSVMSITPHGIKQLKLEQLVARSEKSQSAGFNGIYSSRSGRLDAFSFGKFEIKAPKVGFWEPGTGHDKSHWDVNIGNGFLKSYVLTIDYVSKRVNLAEPN